MEHPRLWSTAANGVTTKLLLESAAIAEFYSEHPVAKAILSKAYQMGIRFRHPDRFDYTPGRGIVARLTAKRSRSAIGCTSEMKESMAQMLYMERPMEPCL